MDSPKAKKELGVKIRQARENANLTQAQVAKKAGINTNYYACIERGEVNPSFEKLMRLVEALGIKSSDILPS